MSMQTARPICRRLCRWSCCHFDGWGKRHWRNKYKYAYTHFYCVLYIYTNILGRRSSRAESLSARLVQPTLNNLRSLCVADDALPCLSLPSVYMVRYGGVYVCDGAKSIELTNLTMKSGCRRCMLPPNVRDVLDRWKSDKWWAEGILETPSSSNREILQNIEWFGL